MIKMPLMLAALFLCALAESQNDRLAAKNVAGNAKLPKHILQKWPHFRGHGAHGHAVHANPPLTWNVKEGKNIRWKTEVPKLGMSSPVIWGTRLFLTGADDICRRLYCFDTDTGKLLWQHDATGITGSPSRDRLPKALKSTGLAAPTVTTDGRYAAAIFATGDMVCVDMAGKRVWAKNMGIPKNPYGHASSLICHEDLLFVQYDQQEDSKLLAFRLSSGAPAWQVKRGDISWSSPILIDNNGRLEIVLTNCKTVDSHDPETGRLLWRVECLAGEVAPSAAYADGVVYVANEYAAASAIYVGDHSAEAKVLWEWDEILPNVASPLANDRYLILPTGYGIVSCLDAKTGKIFWEHEFDKGFYSSPILVNDRVYIIDLSGRMQVFRMDDVFQRLGSAEIGEKAYATPAFVGNRIYIRGVTHLFCIEAQK